MASQLAPSRQAALLWWDGAQAYAKRSRFCLWKSFFKDWESSYMGALGHSRSSCSFTRLAPFFYLEEIWCVTLQQHLSSCLDGPRWRGRKRSFRQNRPVVPSTQTCQSELSHCLWKLQPFPSCPPLPPCPGKESPSSPGITEQNPAAFCPGLLTVVGALIAGLLRACASCLGPWVLRGCWEFPYIITRLACLVRVELSIWQLMDFNQQ